MESCRQSVCDEPCRRSKSTLQKAATPSGLRMTLDVQVDGDTSTMYYIKQESKRIVLFGDIDRRRAFTECHASSSGGHQDRDRRQNEAVLLAKYTWTSCQVFGQHLKALQSPLLLELSLAKRSSSVRSENTSSTCKTSTVN
ncbi:hypothetical protein EMCRGX_G014420 [Ephydatia muelleri]